MTIVDLYNISISDIFLKIVDNEIECFYCDNRWQFAVFIYNSIRGWCPSYTFLCSSHSLQHHFGVSRNIVESEEFRRYVESLKIISE
jgi:hypothetical protein